MGKGLGFIILLLNNVVTLFFSHTSWYLEARTIWMPLAVRFAFVGSIYRIYLMTKKEHEEKLEANNRVELTLSRIKELTEKMVDICPWWKPGEGCTNPKNPDNKKKKKVKK